MELCIKTAISIVRTSFRSSFNPCFNGTMYKNFFPKIQARIAMQSFNPCFNGTMYKNHANKYQTYYDLWVSILVLMELCIKTQVSLCLPDGSSRFNPCFNGTMYKNYDGIILKFGPSVFQSLF